MSSKKSHNSEIINPVSLRLKEARKSARLSTDQLAEKTGIPKSTINNAETGTAIKPENLAKIIRELGLNAEWVIFGEGQPFQKSEIASSWLSISNEESEVNILLEKTKIVLTSGSEGIRNSLKSNINSFLHAVELEKRITLLEVEVERLKSPIPPEEGHSGERVK